MDEPTPRWVRVLRRLFALAAAVAIIALYRMPEPKAQEHPDRIPVRFWHMWSAEWEEVVNGIAREFNESQDKYEVIPLSVPSGADSKFLLAVTGGDPPDVMAQWNAVIPTWAESGLIMPLDDLMGPELLERFRREAYPVARRIGEYKGKVYGITIGINAYGVYYRPSHFREAGLDPNRFPATLEELSQAGMKMNRYDKSGNLTRLGWMPSGLLAYASIFGGGFYDWKTGEVMTNTPENLRALTYLAEYRKRIGYDNIVRFEAGLDTASFAAGWPFIAGAYSATQNGQWRVEQLRKFAPNLDYLTAPIPPPRGGRSLAGWSGGNFMIIPKGAKHVEGAWEFIKFWSGLENPERAAEYYCRGGWLPLWPAVANAPRYRQYIREYPQYATFVKMLGSPNLDAPPPVPYQVYLIDEVNRAEDAAIRGVLSPKEALDRMDRRVREELARRASLGYRDGPPPRVSR